MSIIRLPEQPEAEVTRSAIPQISAAAQRLAELFRSLEPDEVVTYETASAAAGVNVIVKRHVAATARNRVLMDDSIHIATVYGKGFKRLTTREAAEAVDGDMSRAKLAARRGVKKAERVELLELPETERARHVMRTTLCRVVAEGLGSKSRAKLELAAGKGENTAVLAQREALLALMGDD